VFNPIATPQVILALGAVLKEVAGQRADDEYRRGQVLSAYSIARHLAAEETARPRLRAWFGAQLEGILGPGEGGGWAAADPTELGERIGQRLAELRGAEDERSRRTAAELRRALRQLCDREVAALAEAV
jgi:Spy/CpxP family protein refolding chaperone